MNTRPAHDHTHDHERHGSAEHDLGDGPRAWWAPARVGHALRRVVTPHSHDHADSLDEALADSERGIRAVKVSLVVLLVTASAQAVVVAVTGSVALLADTIHNFSDALTAIPLWTAFAVGRRPPSRRYTYGLGRAEDLAGVFIVAMIALSAVVAGVESVRRLLEPQPLTHPWVVVLAGAIGFVGNELVAGYRMRVGRSIGSAALVADGHHARTDGFTSLAVVAGAVGTLIGVPLADPVVGLLITVAILVVLRGAARDIYGRLMDAVDPDLTDRAIAVVEDVDEVAAVEQLRLRWSGHRLLVEASITVDATLGLRAAHDVAHKVEQRLRHDNARTAQVTIRVSPTDDARAPGSA